MYIASKSSKFWGTTGARQEGSGGKMRQPLRTTPRFCFLAMAEPDVVFSGGQRGRLARATRRFLSPKPQASQIMSPVRLERNGSNRLSSMECQIRSQRCQMATSLSMASRCMPSWEAASRSHSPRLRITCNRATLSNYELTHHGFPCTPVRRKPASASHAKNQ